MIVVKSSIAGPIWLFIPKVGRPDYVEPGEILDAMVSLITSTTMYFVPIVAIIWGTTFLSEPTISHELLDCTIVLFGAVIYPGKIKFKRK